MKTLIAVPCQDFVWTEFVKSFIELERDENTAYTFITGTLIYEGRNLIAKNAISYGFDRVLWLDSDMIVSADALKRLSADLDTGKDYVTALYYGRKPPHNPIISNDVVWKVENNEVTTGATSYKDFPKDQVFEINGSGFGCVMTSVELLKDVTERYGAPFTPLMGLGEDYAFCWRVAQIGRKMYCDSRIKCGHLGLCEYRGKDA